MALALIVALVLAAAAGMVWLQVRKIRRVREGRLLSHASFEQSPQAMVLFDVMSLQVIAANASFVKDSGYSADELRGTAAARLFVDETSRDGLMAQLREPTDHAHLKLSLRRKDGQMI